MRSVLSPRFAMLLAGDARRGLHQPRPDFMFKKIGSHLVGRPAAINRQDHAIAGDHGGADPRTSFRQSPRDRQ